MTSPQISVIMPVYNAEKYIEKAILSILKQTFSDFELLIIDDKGNDESMNIVNSICDSRIKIFVNNENKGISYSTNVGLDNACGKYIALMDDDDIAVPDRLETEFFYLENHPDVDVVGGNDMTIDENDNIVSFQQEIICNPKRIKAEFLFCDRIHNATSMFRRSFIKKYNLRYKDGYLGMQDFKFWTECAAYGTIANIDKILSYWRKHKSNTTLQSMKFYKIERKNKFAEILKDSLEMQGFILSEAEKNIFCEVFQEQHTSLIPHGLLMDAHGILKKIIKQSIERKDDNVNELIFACKRNWARKTELCDIWQL